MSGELLLVSVKRGLGAPEVAEGSLNRDTNEIRVHKVWCAIDPGVAVEPRNIEAMVPRRAIGDRAPRDGTLVQLVRR